MRSELFPGGPFHPVPWGSFVSFARRLPLSGLEEPSMPSSKSSARPRSRKVQKGRTKAARRVRQVMPYIQAAATAASAVAALIQAIRH